MKFREIIASWLDDSIDFVMIYIVKDHWRTRRSSRNRLWTKNFGAYEKFYAFGIIPFDI